MVTQERQETNEISPIITQAFWLQSFQATTQCGGSQEKTDDCWQ